MYCFLRYCYHFRFKALAYLKLKYILLGFILIYVLDYCGTFTHIFEVSYDNFSYPYDGEIHEFVAALRNGQKPDVPPINEYNYTFIHDQKDKCQDSNYRSLQVVFLIKSAVKHYDRRMAIRNSWGFEKRFSDVPLRTVFLLGVEEDNFDRARINLEAVKYKDIVQANFLDTYYNNTIKTMMGFKWVMNHCLKSKFYMFVDDDVYVSVKNVLRFIRNPVLYPDYLKDAIKFKDLKHLQERFKRQSAKEKILLRRKPGWKNHNKSIYPSNNEKEKNENSTEIISLDDNKTRQDRKSKRQVFDFELPSDVKLFAGNVIVSSPHRHKTSKWFVTLKEYPFHLWPPYITAGAYILSKEALIELYYASMYTKIFRFDDIFLGIVAKKAGIELFDCNEFYFYKKEYTKYNYKYTIASHGYHDPEELLKVWNEQKAMGNA